MRYPNSRNLKALLKLVSFVFNEIWMNVKGNVLAKFRVRVVREEPRGSRTCEKEKRRSLHLRLYELDARRVQFRPLYCVGSRPMVPTQTQNTEGLATLGLRRECFRIQKWMTRHPTRRERKKSRSRHHSICQKQILYTRPKATIDLQRRRLGRTQLC